MKRIVWIALTLPVILTLLWLQAEPRELGLERFWPLRSAMVQYSGLLAMAAMSVALLLAARPGMIERFCDGLDKTYRLHKWLGIGALLLGVVHWLWAQGPKWAVGLGWLEPPARRGAANVGEGLAALLHEQRGIAESLGEWTFYVAVLLILLALSKRFPYRWFFKTHRFLALAYLLLVYHALILTRPEYWPTPLGLTLGVLLAAGSGAALLSLSRRIGRRHQVIGRIDSLQHHPDNRVLAVRISLDGAWPGHKAGQFAFVTFDEQEGPHPFTISSAWNNEGRLEFSIKALGDYTRQLPQTLRAGDPVTVEGPYGCFDFASRRAGQIWIAGGIGIAPFLARLRSLANRTDAQPIDLFYCTSEPAAEFIEDLRRLAAAARVELHLVIAQQQERLTPERLRESIADWQARDLWFCGPSRFGQQLRRDLRAHGMAAEDFHQELFEMR